MRRPAGAAHLGEIAREIEAGKRLENGWKTAGGFFTGG
jgi:hypothetical protein